jgi:hypothetical protein
MFNQYLAKLYKDGWVVQTNNELSDQAVTHTSDGHDAGHPILFTFLQTFQVPVLLAFFGSLCHDP